MVLSFLGVSIPQFVLAIVLLYVFAARLGWFPIGGYGGLQHLVLPALTLGILGGGWYGRMMRSSMVEVLSQDYIRTARAKGLKDRVVTIRHALRNALVPVTSILGPLIIGIITGSVVIENIFGIPGLGKEFVESITRHDYNVTVGVFTIYAALIGIANLAVDLVYTVIDPRIRY
jgi:peptide/nickel transport system permease protein